MSTISCKKKDPRFFLSLSPTLSLSLSLDENSCQKISKKYKKYKNFKNSLNKRNAQDDDAVRLDRRGIAPSHDVEIADVGVPPHVADADF